MGIIWPSLLLLGLTLNREVLPSLTSPVSLVANAALALLATAAGWVLARALGRQGAGSLPRVRRVGLWVLLAAAGLYLAIWGLEQRERTALSLTRYARDHTSEGESFLEHRASAGEAISAVLPGDTNVLIILMDALRASNMGCYAYVRDTTPHLDALAEESVVFDHAVCAKTSTSPACASLFTGVYPHTHGIVKWAEWLDSTFVTLAECLAANGYGTAQVVNNSNVSDTYNFAQGFQSAEFPEPQRAETLTNAALQQIAELSGESKPWFAYLHYIEPHEPYRPPPPFHRMFVGDVHYGRFGDLALPIVDSPSGYGHIRQTWAIEGDSQEIHDPDYYLAEYDAEIRYAEERVGRVLDHLSQTEEKERTLIVLLADHGESLGEHGWWFGHGANAYEEAAHVPLLFSHPRLHPRHVSGPVETASVMPTILDLLGLDRPHGIEAPTLAHILASEGQTEVDGVAYVEGRMALPLCRAILKDQWKLIWNWPPCSMRQIWSLSMLLQPRARPKIWHLAAGQRRTPVWQLFNLREDPAEQRNVIREHPEVAQELKNLLFAWIACAPGDERQWAQKRARPLTDEDREKLRSLGYVQ